ncbi:MAG: DUF104 domain-containing protein [Methanophagales archaeon]|nr:DUF104 domain-containing protein [Methanophagales archaeon]
MINIGLLKSRNMIKTYVIDGAMYTSPILEERRKKRFLRAKRKEVLVINIGIKAIYEEGILKPLEKIVLEEKRGDMDRDKKVHKLSIIELSTKLNKKPALINGIVSCRTMSYMLLQ